mgnify:CR=1 FL=1|jgi:hypothetical protein
MKNAKIYIPTKSAMQSGRGKLKSWLLVFDTKDTKTNSLMGWESSEDTMSEVRLEFSSKDKAVNYAKQNGINYKLIETKKRKFVLKSYSDNFIKN